MASRGSLRRPHHEEALIGPDDGPPLHKNLAIRPPMWADVCMRLRCHDQTPVKILGHKDLKDRVYEKVLNQLQAVDKLVVIIPDSQANGIWQVLWFVTKKKYFYRPQAQLLGRPWAHWALLIDWLHVKAPDVEKDQEIKPNRTYTAEELEGKVVRTPTSRRRYQRRMFESAGTHGTRHSQSGSDSDAPARH